MKICIDARIPNKGGIRTYTHNLIENLLKIDGENEYYIFYDYNQEKRGVANAIENIVPSKNKVIWILWSQTLLPLFLKKNKIDIFHSVKHVGALWPFSKTKTLLTIHDAGPFLYPQAWPFSERVYWQTMFKLAGKRMDKIITVSEIAKKTLINTLKITEDKIKVTYNGIEHERFKKIDNQKLKEMVVEKYDLPEKFIFWVGLMFKTKNLDTLIRAYAKIKKEQGIKYKLVLGGRKGNSYSELIQLTKELDIRDEVCFPGFIADEDLPVVYNLADTFVFPSIHEGFGIPTLEAMACGIPVLSSNAYALPEVLADAALFFEPYNVNELADKLLKILTDQSLRGVLIEKGIKRASQFTFRECAEDTLNIYKELVN